jgi:hypothetical protein
VVRREGAYVESEIRASEEYEKRRVMERNEEDEGESR